MVTVKNTSLPQKDHVKEVPVYSSIQMTIVEKIFGANVFHSELPIEKCTSSWAPTDITKNFCDIWINIETNMKLQSPGYESTLAIPIKQYNVFIQKPYKQSAMHRCIYLTMSYKDIWRLKTVNEETAFLSEKYQDQLSNHRNT